MRFARLLVATAALVAMLGFTQAVNAADCSLTVSSGCDGNCVEITFGTSTSGCEPASVKIERRAAGGGTWVTLTTNATSPYKDCAPTGCPGGCSYDYRITLDCAEPCADDVQYINNVSCP